jgi:MYXO-CTERM domain-containing protein
VRRLVSLPDGFEAWGFSPFWDQVGVSDAALAALPSGEALPSKPTLVRSDSGAPEVWLIDGPWRRKVPGEAAARAWHFDLGAVVEWAQSDLDALPQGTSVRARPWLIKGSGPEVYLVDDLQTGNLGGGGAGGTTTTGVPTATTGSASATGGAGGGGGGPTTTGASADDAASAESGCGCELAPSPTARGWALALALAAWLGRRRGRPSRS